MKPAGEPPQTLLRCPLARDRPYLDGKLDEAIWREAALAEVFDRRPAARASSQAPLAAAHLARDSEYLYFAIHCRKAPGVDYAAGGEPRTYDAPLENRDRVHLLLDLDRDYATCYRLTVDHRGGTGEACLGNAAWNPEWFVAAAADDESWTVEAAIPLKELTARPPRRREVWAVGVERIVPTAESADGNASWVDRLRPDQFKLLLFE
jgi:hypothetical protein